MPELYQIFDATVSSDFPLPELPRSLCESPDLFVKQGAGDWRRLQAGGFKTAFEWRNADDALVCWCERKGDEYLFVFEGFAAFHISAEGIISCFQLKRATPQLLRHLLLNQIIPRYLATIGRMVLHAGAVTLKNGKTIAFLGNSGFGKSTLVSSFHRHGARLINDDCIMLENSESGVTAIGGLAGIRLFPDSVNAVFTEAAGFTNYTPSTDKQQLYLKDQADAGLSRPCVLDAMFLLNDPQEEPVDMVTVEPVPGSKAMMAIIYSAFSLDPSDRKTIAGNFKNAGRVISEHLPCFSLQYPRVHGRLEEVRGAVENCLVA